MKKGYVYFLMNYTRTTLYIGVTSNPAGRLTGHQTTTDNTFVKRYQIKYLVRLEEYNTMREAIAREKQLKRWHREWKMNLIRSENPDLLDLTDQLPWKR